MRLSTDPRLRLTGSITALATPFAADGAVDTDAFARLIDAQLAAGTSGVVVAGSTGEATALEDSEYRAVLAFAVHRIGRRVPVLAGTGASSTARALALTRLAADIGADAALVATPAYLRPTQAGLLAHYDAIAEQGGLPLVLYNVPARTACDLLPDTAAALARHPRIVGIKEAVSDPARLQSLLALRNEGFAVLCGDDAGSCRAMLAGADGAVSVVGNVVPATFARLCALALGVQAEAAAQLDARLAPLYEFLAVEPNPVPVKALLNLAGTGYGLRLPLLPLSSAHEGQARRMHALAESLEAECRASAA